MREGAAPSAPRGRATTPSRTQRCLDLLALLLGRRYPLSVERVFREIPGYRDEVTRAEAAGIEGDDGARTRTLESLRRKFERDKEELRRLGIPLETEAMRLENGEWGDGYRIPQDRFYLPLLEVAEPGADEPRSANGATSASPRHLRLDTDEAALALGALRHIVSLPGFPLAAEARTALRKLTFDLDPTLAPRVPVRVLERAGGADPQGVLPHLADAVLDRKRVTFHYRRPGRPEPAPREVEPWGLFFQWGGWYLVGHTPGRIPPTRLYRVDRMEDAEVNRRSPGTPDFERPGDFRIGDWIRRRAWELPEPGSSDRPFRVRFLPPLDRVAERNGWGDAETPGGDVRVFQVHREAPFLRWLLTHAGEAVLLEPTGAVERLATLARQLEVRHGR